MLRLLKLLTAALLFVFSPLAHAQANWTVSEVAGKVTVRDATGDHAVSRGASVAAGATLSTGPGARAVVVRGKDFVTVSANSRIRIPLPAQKRGMFEVLQEWGNAIFQIEKKPNPHFGVQTPYLAAVVKGTTFSITVSNEGASLQVLEGAVETSTIDGGARELIRPGILATITAADRYRLTVQGQDTRIIDSPQRSAPPAAPEVPAASTGAGNEAEASVAPAAEPAAAQDAGAESVANLELFTAQMISEPIMAKPVDLGKMTGGLVSGVSAVQVASANAAVVRADLGRGSGATEEAVGVNPVNSGSDVKPGAGAGTPATPGTPAGGNGNGTPGSGNGGADKGTPGDGNGAGTTTPGNGSGGSSGNDAPGKGNDNGAGNGNSGGKDDPSNGNGNGGGKDDPGNGNGNGGGKDEPGNGNGSGGGKDEPGNGNGNGGGKDDPGKGGGPGKDDPGKGDGGPGKDDPGKGGGPGKDDPGKGDGGPGKDDPGKGGGPGKDDPGKDAPGNGRPGPGKPDKD